MVTATAWEHRAACLDVDPEVFFTECPEAARSVCSVCPVQRECLARALEEPYGVWAGTTPDERRVLRGDYFPDLIEREGGWAAETVGLRNDAIGTRFRDRREQRKQHKQAADVAA